MRLQKGYSTVAELGRAMRDGAVDYDTAARVAPALPLLSLPARSSDTSEREGLEEFIGTAVRRLVGEGTSSVVSHSIDGNGFYAAYITVGGETPRPRRVSLQTVWDPDKDFGSSSIHWPSASIRVNNEGMGVERIMVEGEPFRFSQQAMRAAYDDVMARVKHYEQNPLDWLRARLR